MTEPVLKIGDIVEHCIHGKREVIVGMDRDRFLCTYPQNIQKDGKLRPRSRVAIHPEENLRKIGRLDHVIPVSLLKLYGDQSRKLRILPKLNLQRWVVFSMALAVTIYSLFSIMEKTSYSLESYLFARIASEVLAMKEREGDPNQSKDGKAKSGLELKIEKVKKKLGLTDAKIEKLGKRFLKEDLTEEEAMSLAQRYFSSAMSEDEKRELKERYLKPGVTKEEVERVKNKLLSGKGSSL